MSERTEKFTPGKWKSPRSSRGHFPDVCIVSIIDGVETACLAIVCGNGYGFWRNGLENDYPNMSDIDVVNMEMEANANLISAAPDLYEALKAIVDMGHEDNPSVWLKAEMAIKKARGER